MSRKKVSLRIVVKRLLQYDIKKKAHRTFATYPLDSIRLVLRECHQAIQGNFVERTFLNTQQRFALVGLDFGWCSFTQNCITYGYYRMQARKCPHL